MGRLHGARVSAPGAPDSGRGPVYRVRCNLVVRADRQAHADSAVCHGTEGDAMNKNGAVIYHGPSAIDGGPIVVIATGLTVGSANSKTGAMIQTHIMRADVDPLTALRTGADVSVCGGCMHRPQGPNGTQRSAT